MRKIIDRYIDTALYMITVLCVASLIVTTVELKHEVQAMRAQLDILMEETETEIVVEEEEAEDDGSVPGDDIEAQWPKLYTDEDTIALAKMAWGETRGVPELVTDHGVISSKCQQAAVMWTALNRYDAGYADSITAVVTAPKQYHGYSESNPVEDEFLDLAYDVLDRWNREKHGEIEVGRVLPCDRYWFHGDGTYNYFRNEYESNSYWGWELIDVYA